MSNNNKTTQSQLLGTLVHRAVAMPFQKPQKLSFERNWAQRKNKEVVVRLEGPNESLREAVKASLKILLTDLKEVDRDMYKGRFRQIEDYSLVDVIDAGGSWWSRAAQDFAELDDDEREWVLKRLERCVLDVAKWMEREAWENNWKWIQSEMEGTIWPDSDEVETSGYSRSRVDLVVGYQSSSTGRIAEAFDIKVTDEKYFPISKVKEAKAENSLKIADKVLAQRGYNARRSRLLFVDSGSMHPVTVSNMSIVQNWGEEPNFE